MTGVYMNLKITSLMLWIGIIMASFGVFLIKTLTGPAAITIIYTLQFIGVIIVGWALLSYGFAKQLLPVQRSVALFFAAIIIAGLFGVAVTFHIWIT